ncbi:MAG: CYTH domain-containing protein [Cyclobacteriaceae bacterium]
MNSLPKTYKDFTLKALAPDFEPLEDLLKNCGALFLGVDEQKDTYFQTDTGKLKLREGTIENLITHYERILEEGIERTVVYRYDVNPSAIEIENLITNYKTIGTVKKERSIYLLDIHKIQLDRLDQGDFLEIESIDREEKFTTEELRKRCLELKEKLGIADGDLVPTGYFRNSL